MPAIWDPADEAYKDKYTRDMCWSRICRQLYHEFDGYSVALQQKIMHDVKQRWRSVRDRFQKIQAKIGTSGSSPAKIKFSLYKDMCFLLTSRTLRSTDGNISPLPEDASQEAAGSTDSMDGSSFCEPESPCTSGVVSAASSSGMASCAETQNTADPNSQTAANPLTVTEPLAKKSKAKTQKKMDVTTKRVNDTIDLINKSSREDHLDFFGASIASKARLLSAERQTKFMTVVNAILSEFEDPSPISPLADIVIGATQSVRSRRPPPPPLPPPQPPMPPPPPPQQQRDDQRYQRPPVNYSYYGDVNSENMSYQDYILLN
ncbi:uncharacterized protein [Dendrobates tinctorius]|uniref:uncharacterized protein n=1 Tax=Dendrobates tinctorius TaxID=92724 RepID=UPI003CCA5743